MLDAFADREDGRVGGAHSVIDDDAALHLESRRFGERRARANADRHDDELGRNARPVLELDCFDSVLAENGFRVGPGDDAYAAPLEILLQEIAGGGVELAFHQGRHEMEDGDIHPVRLEPVRGFEAEKAAADDDGVAVPPRRFQHRVDVGDVAEGDDARELHARDRDDDRIGSGGDEQRVVVALGAVLPEDMAPFPIDRLDPLAGDELDAALGVPGPVVDDDVVEALLAGEEGREHDAVVVDVRLGAEDRDGEAVRRAGENFLDRAHPGHAVADDDEALFHAASSVGRRWRS